MFGDIFLKGVLFETFQRRMFQDELAKRKIAKKIEKLKLQNVYHKNELC